MEDMHKLIYILYCVSALPYLSQLSNPNYTENSTMIKKKYK